MECGGVLGCFEIFGSDVGILRSRGGRESWKHPALSVRRDRSLARHDVVAILWNTGKQEKENLVSLEKGIIVHQCSG